MKVRIKLTKKEVSKNKFYYYYFDVEGNIFFHELDSIFKNNVLISPKDDKTLHINTVVLGKKEAKAFEHRVAPYIINPKDF